MRRRILSKLVHEGNYVAEVELELIETDEGWSPYLTLEDAYKLDDVRDALRRGDLQRSSFFRLGLYESYRCVSRKKSIRHVVAFSFIAGTAPLWARSPAATLYRRLARIGTSTLKGAKPEE